MAERDQFNYKLEALHKTVKVKTKPSKKPPGLAKTTKPKAAPKKAASPPKQDSSPPPQAPVPEAEREQHDPSPAAVPPPEEQTAAVPAETVPESKVHGQKTATATDLRVVDKTLHRKHKVKDTFTSVFPAYGLLKPEENFVTQARLMSKNLPDAEPLDWSYHMRLDGMKRYTEEMLKAANMRGGKK